MVTWWAQGLQMEKPLVGGGSLVELINREIVSKMNPRPRIYKDSRMKVSLANDATTMYLERVCQDFHQLPKSWNTCLSLVGWCQNTWTFFGDTAKLYAVLWKRKRDNYGPRPNAERSAYVYNNVKQRSSLPWINQWAGKSPALISGPDEIKNYETTTGKNNSCLAALTLTVPRKP